MSVNAYLVDANTRHQIYLLRHGASLANEIIPEVERIIEQVAQRVATTPDQIVRQRLLLLELRTILRASYEEVGEKLAAGAARVALYESEFQHRLLGGTVSASLASPSIEQITVAVTRDLMSIEPGRQMTIQQALSQFSDKKTSEVIRTISDGILTQQTSKQISDNVQALGIKQRHQADALARTVTNGAADMAKRALFTENEDILEGEQWVSTLDSRTTIECMARDGNVYPVGKGPSAPAHWNCRSLRIPKVAQKYALKGFEGVRPSRGDDGAGTVSTRTTYTGFLKRQSKEFQDDALGIERAKLFRSGKLTLKDMVNSFGEPLTLDELRAREGLTI